MSIAPFNCYFVSHCSIIHQLLLPLLFSGLPSFPHSVMYLYSIPSPLPHLMIPLLLFSLSISSCCHLSVQVYHAPHPSSAESGDGHGLQTKSSNGQFCQESQSDSVISTAPWWVPLVLSGNFSLLSLSFYLHFMSFFLPFSLLPFSLPFPSIFPPFPSIFPPFSLLFIYFLSLFPSFF